MRFKKKMVIFLASVLLTILGFNLMASFVYGSMAMRGKYAELKVITSCMAKAEKESLYDTFPCKNR